MLTKRAANPGSAFRLHFSVTGPAWLRSALDRTTTHCMADTVKQ